ncbi:MAG: DUF530 family protein [Candidatus Anstonellales archaeon]
MDYETSESLLGKANEFLDRIDSFNPKNIAKIQELVEKMQNQGFANPFKPILIPLKDVEVSAETKKDIRRQIRKMKEIYLLKKFTLRRAKVSFAAHSLCNHFKKTNYFLELEKYLPYDGSYVKRIASYNIYAYEAYLAIMQFLSTSIEEYSVLITLKYKDEKDNEIIENFKLINPNNINERIKAIYGNSAQILGTKFLNPQKNLIKGVAYRIALTTALTTYSLEKNRDFINDLLENKTSEKYRKYSKIMKAHKLNELYRIDLVNGYEEVKEEIVKKDLGFYDSQEFFLDNDLAKEIESLKNLIKRKLYEDAKWLIQNYLLQHLLADVNFNFIPNFTLKNKELYAELFEEFKHNENYYSLKEPIKEYLDLVKFEIVENNKLMAALIAKHLKNSKIAAEIIGLSSNEVEKTLSMLEKVNIEKLKKFHE